MGWFILVGVVAFVAGHIWGDAALGWIGNKKDENSTPPGKP